MRHQNVTAALVVLVLVACAPPTASPAVPTALPASATPAPAASPAPRPTDVPTDAPSAFQATVIALATAQASGTAQVPLNAAVNTTSVAGAMPTAAAASAQNAPTLSMGDDFYDPSVLTVPAGSTVTWRNTGGEGHDVRAFDNSFVGPLLANGQTWSYTFAQPGTYRYFCTPHAGSMTGTIVVQ